MRTVLQVWLRDKETMLVSPVYGEKLESTDREYILSDDGVCEARYRKDDFELVGVEMGKID